jgi:hypothetical protein
MRINILSINKKGIQMKKKLLTALILVSNVFAFDIGGSFSIEGGVDKGLNLMKNGANSVKNSVSNVLNSKELKDLYNKIPNGNELLEKCKQSDKCNPYKFVNVIKNSNLVKFILNKRPHLTLPEIANKVNFINNYIMDKYFEAKGFKKVVNGLFIKENYGKIAQILIVSGNNNFNLIKEHILKQVINSKIKQEIENGNYMPLLWNMQVKSNNKINISIKPADDKNSKLATNYKMKVKYQTHEEINMQHPKNNFQRKLIYAYKDALRKF